MLLSFTESSTTEIETYSHLLQSEEREKFWSNISHLWINGNIDININKF